jgi:TetR/AcrR family transcriptional regulator, cholesterol catabolism regulator
MRKDSGIATREALLESSIKLFAQRGYEATAVQEIVDGASATKGAFYHHFRSKLDLLVAIHRRTTELQLGMLQEIADRELPCSVTLALMLEGMIAQHDSHNMEMAIYNQERWAFQEPAFEPIRKLRNDVERIFSDVVKQGIETGEFRPVPSIRILVFALIGVSAWLYQWWTPSGEMTAREIGRVYTILLLDGLRGTDSIDGNTLDGESESFAKLIGQIE